MEFLLSSVDDFSIAALMLAPIIVKYVFGVSFIICAMLLLSYLMNSSMQFLYFGRFLYLVILLGSGYLSTLVCMVRRALAFLMCDLAMMAYVPLVQIVSLGLGMLSDSIFFSFSFCV